MRQIDADVLKTLFAPGGTYRTKSILHKIDAAPTIQPQAAHLMALDEIRELPIGTVVWLEYKWFDEDDGPQTSLYPLMCSVCCGDPVLCDGESQTHMDSIGKCEDGEAERYWSACPTDEQRRMTPWK